MFELAGLSRQAQSMVNGLKTVTGLGGISGWLIRSHAGA